jgi:hypothetical protein
VAAAAEFVIPGGVNDSIQRGPTERRTHAKPDEQEQNLEPSFAENCHDLGFPWHCPIKQLLNRETHVYFKGIISD